MTTPLPPTQYSPEELDVILLGAECVPSATMTADDGKVIVAALRETLASGEFASTAATDPRYLHNALVQHYLERMAQTENVEQGEAQNLLDHDYLVAQIDRMLMVLRPDDEAYAFKHFLYGMARAVAEAAGEGLFGSGVKVTEGEAEFLAALQQKFGLA